MIAGSRPAFEQGADAPLIVECWWLGPPRVFVHTQDGVRREVRWVSRRAHKTLALLALEEDRSLPRDRLLEALWPDIGPGAAHSRLHPTLTLLRRALAGAAGSVSQRPARFVVSDGGVFRLDPAVEWRFDFDRVDEAIRRADRHTSPGDWTLVREALVDGWQVYRGAFGEGWDDLWVLAARERWRTRRHDLLRRLADVSIWLGRYEEAVDALRSVLIEEPVSESDHVALLRVFAAQGRRDLVRRQYETLTRLLAEELGVEPLPATIREVQRLMTVGIEDPEDAAGGGSAGRLESPRSSSNPGL